MKIFGVILILIASITTQANVRELEYDSLDEDEILCEYDRPSGVELFEDVKKAHIQLLHVILNESLGAIVLAKGATVQGQSFKECWGLSHSLQTPLLIFCTNTESKAGDVPQLILNEIERIKRLNI